MSFLQPHRLTAAIAGAQRAVKPRGLVDTAKGFSGFWVVLRPGWLKKPLTKNYSYESHRWGGNTWSKGSWATVYLLWSLPIVVNGKGATPVIRNLMLTLQLKSLWLLLCCRSRRWFFFWILSISNTHIECKWSSPGHKPAIFHPSCPVSVPVAPLRATATRHLRRGNVMMPDCCIASLSHLFQQPKGCLSKWMGLRETESMEGEGMGGLRIKGQRKRRSLWAWAMETWWRHQEKQNILS